MISDAFDMTLVHDVVYEVNCSMITVRKGADVDIGANASTEEDAEVVEDGQEVVNNVVHSFRLVQTGFDFNSYMVHIKAYLKKVKEHLITNNASPEEIKTFEAGAKKFVGSKLTRGSIEGKNRQWDFYIGEDMNVDGMVVLLGYREDGSTPYAVFWKHGLKEEKV
ncbi:Mss4-like protein [Tuber indicum]|nr:Mss4-like protein [Tuber indicum]